ncbi:MAG: nickel-dependent lactate racemase [SAR202 cluster bacterium]|nr:nickel-dependent lactate racemase [SAR202 cluster bacterium]
MQVDLAYGASGLKIELPDAITTVIEPTYLPGLPDERGALKNAIRNPIGKQPLRLSVKPNQKVAISVCDITRPFPSKVVLPVLLGELAHLPKENISILIAAGTHRAQTAEELDAMLSPEVARNYRIVNHSAFDKANLVHTGDTPDGIPIWLNRHFVEADFRITTGFVEPHFFAGFSGGPKMVAPGLAGFDTIMRLHNAEMIGSPKSVWGIVEDNPIHTGIRQIAKQTGVDFSLDVTINREHKITSVYAGELFEVHKAARNAAKRWAMKSVPKPFDIVITTNSGYPLDQNLYQAVKGMSAAAQIVKEGGTIICAAECRDGLPEHGEFKKLLSQRDSADGLLEMINAHGHNRHDQWQVQILAQLLKKARIFLKSSYLTPEQVRLAKIEPTDNIERTVHQELARHGAAARICVLPQGPQTIPYVG